MSVVHRFVWLCLVIGCGDSNVGSVDAMPLGDAIADAAGTSPGIDHFFALGVNRDTTAWPTVPFGTIRLWDSAVAWTLIEPTQNNFTWDTLDAWLDAAQQHGVEVLYTFGRTPSWASMSSDAMCAFGAGQCTPPSDLAADGSGTDLAFSTFAAALIQHAGNRIQYYEVWNEVNNTQFWTGTAPQLVRLATDVRAAVAAAGVTAKVLTPSTCNCANGPLTGTVSSNPQDGMSFYLAASYGGHTGAELAGGIAFHPYLGAPAPEKIAMYTDLMKAAMAARGVANLPLWDTESSWGKNRNVTGCPANDTPPFTAACQSAMADFLARSMVLAASHGVDRFFWYQWDNPANGTLWDAADGANPGAAAYAAIETWMNGATLAPCTATGSVWTCEVTRTGYHGAIVWDAAGTSMYQPAADLTQWEDLAGTSHPITTQIAIGTTPILVETSAE